jgi:hypothetical protein
MNEKTAKKYLQKTKKIEGWFSIHDVISFASILKIQEDLMIPGSLLEIGVYQGKSALLIGSYSRSVEDFEVCDIFGLESDVENKHEISSSYRNLNREIFENNFLNNLGALPVIHECKSIDLSNKLHSNSYRFIHIDGSHLYSHVVHDVQLALDVLTHEDGVIVMDDFRSQHTIGVSLAIWEKIIESEFRPFLVTPAKMYLSKKLSKINLEIVSDALNVNGVKTIYENLGDFQIIRTLDLPDGEVYKVRNLRSELIPPAIIKIIRKIASSF